MKGAVSFDFSGCRVLVTGGSNGIGTGIARAFLDAGAQVTITGRRARASDYDTDLSGLAYRPLEMADPAAVTALAESLGALDVRVNTAGASLAARNEALPDVFEEAVSLHLFGAYRLTAACEPLLAESEIDGGGSVLFLASMSAFFGIPMTTGYGAAKAAVVQLTKGLAVRWAARGIRVNAVAPGLVETNMTRVMKGIEPLEKPQLDRTPMRRWGTVADVTPVALFLASPGARFITGQTYCVDGGYSIA